MKQTTILKSSEIKKRWFVIDASNQIVGKVATLAATYLRGKNKSTFTPHLDMGDNIIVVNAKSAIFSANKEEKKLYYSHSGYPGGLKVTNASSLRSKNPVLILQKAIRGMLPHTKLGRRQFKNLYIYEGQEHNQVAQKPRKLEL